MRVSVTEAKAKLTDLVRRAEAGEEIVLTRHGKSAVRLALLDEKEDSVEARMARLREISRRGRQKPSPDASAARAADFLYDEHGLPK